MSGPRTKARNRLSQWPNAKTLSIFQHHAPLVLATYPMAAAILNILTAERELVFHLECSSLIEFPG